MMRRRRALSSDSSDDWNQHWSEFADSAEQNPAQRWRRMLITQRLNAHDGDRVLDIGSGQGDLARDLLMAIPGLNITGLELAQSGVETSRHKVPDARFFQVNLIGDHPVVEEAATWASHVVCSEVLEHVDEPAELLRAGLAHAADGALVVVTVPAGPRTAFDEHIGHRRHFDEQSLSQVLREAGLVEVEIEAAGMPFFNLYRLVVFARGKRLIEEASTAGRGTESRLARTVLTFFDRTIPLSRRRGRFGWQLIAVGKWPGAPRAST